MSASTDKAIDNIMQAICGLYGGGGDCGVYTIAVKRDQLRNALVEFARSVRQDAIEGS